MQVEVNESAVRSLSIVNVGRFICDYSWELKHSTPSVVSISPQSGSVAHGDKADCDLSFSSSQPTTLRHCELTLKVRHSTGLALLHAVCRVFHGFSFVCNVL